MLDTPQSRAAFLSELPPPAYRVILLAKDGAVVGAVCISAQGDGGAIERAKSMVDGHAVELWDGVRFIEHFPPIDTNQ